MLSVGFYPEMTMMTQENTKFAEIQSKVASIQGWVNDQAGWGLYQLARSHAPIPIIVELGSWRGRSTVWLGTAIVDRGEGSVYAIDRWDHQCQDVETERIVSKYPPDHMFLQFLETMQQNGLDKVVRPIRNDSHSAAAKWDISHEIGLLFIDADHDYHAVRKDFENWSRFVVSGGFVVFDDVPSWPGPTQVSYELPRWMKYVATLPNQIVFQKT